MEMKSVRTGQSAVFSDRENLKPIFHWKLCSRWLPNASESDTNNMKSTWPMQEFCIGDPTRPTFHLFTLGVCSVGNANFSFCVGGNANFSVFRYQDVGISNAKLLHSGYCPTRRPNASVFASQWNIGLTLTWTKTNLATTFYWIHNAHSQRVCF